jgi:hypothetical protein
MTKTATETSIHTTINTIGLDIAKNSFAVHGFDADGKTEQYGATSLFLHLHNSALILACARSLKQFIS